MTNKQTGAVLLIAGTCIGSGMIALPLILAKLGIIPSIFLMFVMSIIGYYSALMTLELILQAGRGLTLGELGKLFSGKIAGFIGVASFKILSYALLAVFIYGGSSILQKLGGVLFDHYYSFVIIASFYSIVSIAIFLLPMKLIDYFNRILFSGLLIIVGILMIGLVAKINWTNLPLFPENSVGINEFFSVFPTLFTSFGFQGSIPIIFASFGFSIFSNIANNDRSKEVDILRKSFKWGVIIPAIVYIVWTCGILSVTYDNNPNLYKEMVVNKVDVGDLIKELSVITKWHAIQILVWIISSLAILTSVIGVGLSLKDSMKTMLPSRIGEVQYGVIPSVIAILPSYLMAILIPNAFLSVLGFAGMILVIIAILLPAYLLFKIRGKELYFSEMRNKLIVWSLVVAGSIIIIDEIVGHFK